MPHIQRMYCALAGVRKLYTPSFKGPPHLAAEYSGHRRETDGCLNYFHESPRLRSTCTADFTSFRSAAAGAGRNFIINRCPAPHFKSVTHVLSMAPHSFLFKGSSSPIKFCRDTLMG
jgi:hypothetical protein